MGEFDGSKAVASDLTSQVTDFSIDAMDTDSVGEQNETEWTNANWTQYFGYYNSIPELRGAIDALATWTTGKGFKADPQTELLLMTIKGWGKENFNQILKNMIRQMHIGGDAYCEIIRDKEGILINLKPLDPGAMKHIVNRQGIIIRFEQVSKHKTPNKRFKVNDIFYLARNRVADQIHGTSIIAALEQIILAIAEAEDDYQEVLHRFVKPKFIFHLDTDDATKIAKIKATNDAATGKGENIYVPKGAVIPELLAVPANSTLNPITWIQDRKNKFYEACGVPQIIVGNSQDFTEAAVKIVYLAFQQTIEDKQLYIEEEILSQLNIAIELEFPASLENELISDKAKDETNGAAQPNETTVPTEQTQ